MRKAMLRNWKLTSKLINAIIDNPTIGIDRDILLHAVEKCSPGLMVGQFRMSRAKRNKDCIAKRNMDTAIPIEKRNF